MKSPLFAALHELSFDSVFAIWRRHVALYRKTWLTNLIPPVSEPIIYLIGFGLGFTPLVSKVSLQGQSIGYLEFLATGMIMSGVLFQSFFESIYGVFVRIRFQGVWKGMLTAPVSYADIFFGDLLWGTTKGTITGVLTGLVAVLWGIFPLFSLFMAFPIIVLGSLVFSALGMLSAGLIRTIDEANVPAFLLVVPMPLFCGAYFPRELLPTTLATATQFLPLTQLIDLLRFGVQQGLTQAFIQVIFLVFWFIALSAPAFLLLRKKVIR